MLDRQIGRRIAVCGTSGSGKSTLARQLAERLGVPYVELDEIQHGPNWTITPLEEFRERVDKATVGDGWVVDGTYGKSRDIVWSRADTVIWLDYTLPVILWRLTRRTVTRGLLRVELWHGNRESLWRHLFVPKDSLYWWVLTTYKKRRRDCDASFADPAHEHLTKLRLRDSREADAILADLHNDLSRLGERV
jgi:adenylate kinase family enzyme